MDWNEYQERENEYFGLSDYRSEYFAGELRDLEIEEAYDCEPDDPCDEAVIAATWAARAMADSFQRAADLVRSMGSPAEDDIPF